MEPIRRPDLEALLPFEVRCVAQADPRGWDDLFPQEAQIVAAAVERRRAQFAAGRRCARRAVELLGGPATAIGSGPRNAPLFPPGFLGSISHTDRMAIAVAAPLTSAMRSVAIDVEPNKSLPEGVAREVVFGEEADRIDRARQANPSVAWDRFFFCAKEVTYKAWAPLVGAWLGFEEARVLVDPSTAAFRSVLEPVASAKANAPQCVLGGGAVLDGHLVVCGFAPTGQ